MPGKIKVKVLAGRNLPVMDRASDTTDAFVEIKFGSVTHKTDVCRKSLNPHWNSTEWYRFEVDESELQDEPLQLRLMDHDTYSANDAIGKVVISLAPLLAREANNAKSTTAPHGGAVMSGWIPVFDTMHGIRGELNVIVKVELFSDFNKYKTSSCGVQFFHCPMIPPGYRATAIHGFVEELVVNDDPEYQWIDKIRTPRASNEARQVAFIKLSNQVQRLVGLKAAELGANAVVGYQQDFDLEGEAGVVARAVGTAVCITPLPLPSQPMNMPPCTQQQLKKYLDILVTDNESLTDLNQYYQTHQEELQKMLTILSPNASALLDSGDTFDDDEKSMDLTRQSSITSYAGSVSILQDEFLHHRSFRHLSEDQTDLNKLLNKDSDDSDSSGPLQKIKKIKTNFFTKRFAKRRSKKSEKSDKQDDSISIKSNTSETSRLSLVDIKNEFKKLKRLKKPKFRKPAVVNKDDEGEGMASILARSVIHAHTSLACIAETQDSEHSPGSTMRRTSESEPTLTVSAENIATNSEGGNDKNVPEIRFTSLSNINTEDSPPKRERKISESCPATPMPNRSNDNTLPLPGQSGYFGSVSSALSAESSELESSSDEEDDESSDLKTDTEKSIETTSSVVQSVLNQEANPTFIAQMDKKLDDLESGSPDNKVKPQEIRQELDKKLEVEQQVFDNQVIIDKCKSLESVPCEVDNKNMKEKPVRSNEASTSSVKDETCVAKPSSHHIKFHNPFAHKKASKSISEPSSPVDKGSFVHRSSKRIKRQLSKLSKSNMIKSLSHYSLHPKKKESKTPLSQPGSSSDIPSKAPSETVLGSPFMSYNDLLSLDRETHDNNKFFHKSDEFDRNKFSMYIGSEPASRASICGSLYPYNKEEHHDHHKKSTPCLKSSGLVHTAMETILLDKVQNLLIPTSPSPDSVKNKQFFDDVNEKLGQVEEDRNKAIRKESMERKLQAIPLTITKVTPVNTKPVIVSTIYKKDKDPNLVKSSDMIYTDRSHSLATTPDSLRPDFLFIEPPEGRHDASKSKLKKPLDLIHSLLVPRSPESTSPTEKTLDSKKKREIKPSGLIHTAMETMLMEKVQSVLGPETPEPTYSIFDDYNIPKRKSKHHDELKSSGLVHTAFETMLLDKVQASALGANMPDAVINKNVDTESIKSHKDDLSQGLVKTAMETMLLDKFYTSELGASSPDPVITEQADDKHSKDLHKDEVGSKGLVKSAMETMLLDKLYTSELGAPMPDPVIAEDSDEHSKDLYKDEDCSKGLVKTAMETMLLDKLYTSELGAPVPAPVITEDDDVKPSKHFNKDDANSKGLVKTAMETMLLDQLYTSELGASLPDPVIDVNDHRSSKTSNNDSSSSKGLVKTAVETMLLDKLYTSELGTPLPDPIIVEKNADDTSSNKVNKENEVKGLTNTAMETILMDKVQNFVGQPGMTFVEPQTFTDEELENAEHLNDDLKSPGLVQSAVQTILLDKVQSLVGQNEIAVAKDTPTKDHHLKHSGLVHTAFKTILLEKVQSMIPTESEVVIAETKNTETEQSEAKQAPSLFNSAMQTILMDKVQALLPTRDEKESETKAETSKPVNKAIEKSKSVPEPKNKNKLTRQDSIHSVTEKEAPKMSDKPNPSPCEVTKPDHPLGVLETIPSLPEGSIDLDNIEETNISVCDNSHAVCGVNRNEKERRVEDKCEKDKDRGSPRHARHESYGGKDPPPAHAQNSSLNASSTPMGIHRRSSDSDLSVTPKGSSLNTSAGNVGSGGGAILRPSMNSNNLDMLEYPFLTMTEYPPGFIVHIGGTVCARSVKLADGGEGAARAAWWAELRTELRAHARALRCNAVIAYTDSAAICEDVCVLSASGTAAVINLDCDFNAEIDGTITVNTGSKNAIDELESDSCSTAHVPYSPGAGPYRAELSACGGCRRARVPTVLLATCAKPNKLISYAKAVTLTAVAARVRRAPPTSEPGARDISDQLPFLEYELHKLLLAKLRMQGANALFSLQTQIAIGERCVMALASGTAVRLAALPPPTPPRIKASENDKDALEIQKALWESFTANRTANGYDIGVQELNTNGVLPEVEGEDAPALDLCVDKDACVLELDEAEDVETARALAKRHVNMQVFTNTLKPVIGAPPHAFAQVWRGRLVLSGGGVGGGAGAAGGAACGVERHVRRALAGVAYKLRRLQPCALIAPKFRLELPEDEIQLVVSGAAIPLCDPNSPDSNGMEHSNQPGNHGNHGNGDADDDIFALDEEQLVKSAPQTEVVDDKNCLNGQAPTTVSLTSLSHVSGGRIVRRLCALRLLFVRETTAVRELGGLSGFLHTFTCEVLAIVRAYTAALGGNALTSFYITQLMLQDNAHKNQGQCLLSVGGDVVHITY